MDKDRGEAVKDLEKVATRKTIKKILEHGKNSREEVPESTLGDT